MAFDKAKYDIEYAKAHITRKFIPFNDTNPEDAALLAWLGTKDNVTQYIKRLITNDMALIRCQNGCQAENETAGSVDE